LVAWSEWTVTRLLSRRWTGGGLGDAHSRNHIVALRAPECRHVVWDEPNLEYNEANRSSTMKIDEPDTPWASPRALSADGTCISWLLWPVEYTTRVHQPLAWVHSCSGIAVGLTGVGLSCGGEGGRLVVRRRGGGGRRHSARKPHRYGGCRQRRLHQCASDYRAYPFHSGEDGAPAFRGKIVLITGDA
jgi:hypothetical protein